MLGGPDPAYADPRARVCRAGEDPIRAPFTRSDGVVLADGFSCRTQLDDLAGVRALHLAELLCSGPRFDPHQALG